MLDLICDQPYLCKFSLFSHYFLMRVLVRLYIISPKFTRGLKTGNLNVALGCFFQFFPINERDKKKIKKLEFPRLGSVC